MSPTYDIVDLFATQLAATADSSHDELRAECWTALAREFNPVGFVENLLVRTLARRAAQNLVDEQSYDDVVERAEQAFARLSAPVADETTLESASLLRARLGMAEQLAAFDRRNAHKADLFARGLRDLRKLQLDRREADDCLLRRDSRFLAEHQCLAYLVRRFRAGLQYCRRCNQPEDGSWIATRRCWQCRRCAAQTCVRHGTVLARSALPLVSWFHAVGILLSHPHVTPRELSVALGIVRLPTVRSMRTRITSAMLADEASALLAGLDGVYLPAT